jgi:hypothetical protein
VERAAWTDERLDDLAESMRSGFDRLDHDLRDLRVELRGEIRELRGDIASLKMTLIRISGAGMVTLLGIIAAILTRA